MEKMKSKQTIEVLKEKKLLAQIEHNRIDEPKKKENLREYIQAIDHAINCVGAIEQIRAERDIAIQQLNELGYQFGEKIRSDEE